METMDQLKAPKRVYEEYDTILEPLLVRVSKHGTAPRDVRIDKNEFKVGRGRENDEIILDTAISRRHCIFRREADGEWTIEDLSSSCTTVNDALICPGIKQRILVGDMIQFSPDEQFRYVFTLTTREDRNIKRPCQYNRVFDSTLAEHKIPTEHYRHLTNVPNDKLAANETHPAGLKEKAESPLKRRQEDSLAVSILCKCDGGSLGKCIHMETWKVQQQELHKIIENIKKEEKDIRQLLLAEKITLEKRLEETEIALKQQENKIEASQLADETTNNGDPSEQTQIARNMPLTNVAGEEYTQSRSTGDAFDKVGEIMDEQLTCSICSELFVKATTLNCKHTFCQYCIHSWNKRRTECPVCRATVTSKNGALALDNFIEQMVENLPVASKARRKQMIKDREALEGTQSTKQIC